MVVSTLHLEVLHKRCWFCDNLCGTALGQNAGWGDAAHVALGNTVYELMIQLMRKKVCDKSKGTLLTEKGTHRVSTAQTNTQHIQNDDMLQQLTVHAMLGVALGGQLLQPPFSPSPPLHHHHHLLHLLSIYSSWHDAE